MPPTSTHVPPTSHPRRPPVNAQFVRKTNNKSRIWWPQREGGPAIALLRRSICSSCSTPAPRLLHACSLRPYKSSTFVLKPTKYQAPSTEYRAPSTKCQVPRNNRAKPKQIDAKMCCAGVSRSVFNPAQHPPWCCATCQDFSVRVKSKTTPLTPHAAAANAADLHPRPSVPLPLSWLQILKKFRVSKAFRAKFASQICS